MKLDLAHYDGHEKDTVNIQRSYCLVSMKVKASFGRSYLGCYDTARERTTRIPVSNIIETDGSQDEVADWHGHSRERGRDRFTANWH